MPPSDAEVEAAARALFIEPFKPGYSDETVQDIAMAGAMAAARAALAAAEAVREPWKDAGTVEAMWRQNGFEAGHAAALEEAAKVAKVAWLTCSYNVIADAEAMQAVCEHAEERIRALGAKP